MVRCANENFIVFAEKFHIVAFGTKDRSHYRIDCIFGVLYRIVSYQETGVKYFITIYVINCGQISEVIDTIGCHRLADNNRNIESRCEFFASGRSGAEAECGRHFLHYHAFSFCGDNYSASVCTRRARGPSPRPPRPRASPPHIPGHSFCVIATCPLRGSGASLRGRHGCILDQITFASEYFITALLLALHGTALYGRRVI